jgi:hypothetical protein
MVPCSPVDPGSRISVGAALYYLKPFFDNNQAYRTIVSCSDEVDYHNNQENYYQTQSVTEFGWDYSASPLVWLSWECDNGWALRTRFFEFNQNPGTLSATSPQADYGVNITRIAPSANLPGQSFVSTFNIGNGTSVLSEPRWYRDTNDQLHFYPGYGENHVQFHNSMELYHLDFELSHSLFADPCTLVFSGGARYLSQIQRYVATMRNDVTLDNGDSASESSFLDYAHSFHGAGPTLALQVIRQLGCSPWSLYGSMRGSLLVGTATSSMSIVDTLDDPDNITKTSTAGVHTAHQVNQGTYGDTRSSTMPIAEMEIGVEYNRSYCNCSTFGRIALVDQTYFGAGSPTSEEGNLSLFGVQASLGIGF